MGDGGFAQLLAGEPAGDRMQPADSRAAERPESSAPPTREAQPARDERGERTERSEARRADEPAREPDRDALQPVSARDLQMTFEARVSRAEPAGGLQAPGASGAVAASVNAQAMAQRLLRSMAVHHAVDGSTAVQLEVGSGRLRGLRVDLTLEGGRVAARLRAADAGAARLLGGAEEALGAALAKRGVALGQVSVEVDPRPDHQPPGRDAGSGGNARDHGEQRERRERPKRSSSNSLAAERSSAAKFRVA
ncbi:MAG: flagellar hook-length control protein FliK [Myxococcales bacterium]|nr:flagellar hook-length control protein FliK [Myxococcales bacterium]